MNLQACSKCKVEKPLVTGFYKNAKCASGYDTVCKECKCSYQAVRRTTFVEQEREYNRAYRQQNKEQISERRRAYRERNAEQIKVLKREYYLRNKAVIDAKNSEWQRNNPERVAKRNAKWKRSNPDKVTIQTIRRLEHIKRATPAWANEFFIQEAYHIAKVRGEKVGGQWHVDHVIPLRGKLVCGLHVENNLQVIPAKANLLKNAKFQTY
jgi:hypothetical protein